MSWHQRRTTLFVVLACGILSASCDGDLGFGDDDDADLDEHYDENHNHPVSSGSSGGGFASPVLTGEVSSHAPDSHDNCSGDCEDDDTVVVDVDVDTSENPRVIVDQGELEGRWVDGKIRRFLGIPYAEPPVDDLRWEAPQEPDSWSGKRQADKYGPRCAQLASNAYENDYSGDEDCLYLNVWTPNVSESRKLPVLFWLHGGDHTYGSASDSGPGGKPDYYYEGTSLAERGVVVVSANYRLGPLGFLTHPALDDDGIKSGNQGLLDQQAALLWIKDNIQEFGGDPDNVTLFGQGSGASDVCIHVVAPSSQNYFSQAISQSGGCTTYQPTARDVARATDAWIADLGCSAADDVVTCLRKKPVKALLAAIPARDSPFVATVDRKFLPDQPRYLYEEGGYSFPYVLGSNTFEGTWYDWEYDTVTTEAAYHDYLKKRFPDLSLETLCELYPHDQYGTNATAYKKALARLFSDYRVTCAVDDTALRASDAGADVYVYNFDVTSTGGPDGVWPGYGSELGYVFGTSKLSDDQHNVSNLIQTYWTNLGKYGNPDNGDDDLLGWSDIYRDGDVRVNFALPDTKVVHDYHSKECVFWRKFYDSQFDNYDAPK